MKKIVLIAVIIQLLIISGCQKPTDDKTGAILFVDDNRQYAYVICRFESGTYRDLSVYKYDNKNWLDFIYEEGDNVKTDVLKPGDTVNFYNASGDKQTAECSKVSCEGRGIDVFTEVHAHLAQNDMLSSRYIGLTANINPMPRTPLYSENSISVDLDNDGTMDKIEWNFSDSGMVGSDDMQNYSLTITLNNKSRTIKNPEELPLNPGDLTVFVADLNGDGVMEVVIYEKLAALMSGLTVYTSINGNIEKMFNYVINPGP